MPNYSSYKNWIYINKLWILHLFGFKYSFDAQVRVDKVFIFLSIIFFECLSFSHHCLLTYRDDNYGFTQKKTVFWCFFFCAVPYLHVHVRPPAVWSSDNWISNAAWELEWYAKHDTWKSKYVYSCRLLTYRIGHWYEWDWLGLITCCCVFPYQTCMIN